VHTELVRGKLYVGAMIYHEGIIGDTIMDAVGGSLLIN
jgi:hypothetical protein